MLAAAVTGGSTQVDQTRNVTFGGLALAAHSNPNVNFITSQLRGAYVLESGAWSFKPTVDLNVTYLSRSRDREDGAGAANLIIGGDDNTVFSGAPSVEISRDYAFESGMKIRPFVDLGLTVFANTDQTFTRNACIFRLFLTAIVSLVSHSATKCSAWTITVVGTRAAK